MLGSRAVYTKAAHRPEPAPAAALGQPATVCPTSIGYSA